MGGLKEAVSNETTPEALDFFQCAALGIEARRSCILRRLLKFPICKFNLPAVWRRIKMLGHLILPN